MVLGWPSTKIPQIYFIHWKIWPLGDGVNFSYVGATSNGSFAMDTGMQERLPSQELNVRIVILLYDKIF